MTDILQNLGELASFARVKVALSIVFLAVSAHLMFNPFGAAVLFASLGSFFVSCGSYGYNTITDKEEDAANRRSNPLAFSGAGAAVVLFSFALGLLASYSLGAVPLIMSVLAISTAVIYSRFRLKKHTFFKNAYTAFTVPFSFIFGAMKISPDVLQHYLAFALFFFIGSVVSDLRDYEGDRRAGIRTLPVRFGAEKTKTVLYLLIAVLFFAFLKMNVRLLLPLIAMLPIAILFIAKNEPRRAHSCMGTSLLLLMVWVAVW